MNVHFQRATLLLSQHRPEQAQAELHQVLADDPNHAPAHALLAMCLAGEGKHAEATSEAQTAIGVAPEMPFGHYVLASVLFGRNRFDEALQAVDQAIQLDPADPDYYALLASIRLEQKKWNEALDAADQGLAHDAQHIRCTNLRATALTKLGRKQEAAATVEGNLARNPEDALSHTTMGWTLLERHQPREALEHFREALRLEPDSRYARAGMVEALKARYWIYGLMLRYFMWMSKLSRRAQWGVVLGGYFGMQFLERLQESSPAISPWIWPIRIVYIGFVLLTWLAYPLFNLILRLSKFGRYALSREQVVASNWVGGCLALAIVLVVAAILLVSPSLLLLALVAGFVVLPLSAVFICSNGWPRRAMAGYTALLALVGSVAALNSGGDAEFNSAAVTLFVVGIFASGFVANGLMMVRPKL